jgi:hypothetical protein
MPSIPTMLSRRLRRTCAVLLLLATAACAQLPSTASVTIPPIPRGEARVWFYRQVDIYDSLNTPYIRMNEKIVAISEPGGASYRDVPAGQYHITVDSYGKDFNQDKDVALVPGQELYVKIVSLRDWIAGGGSEGRRRQLHEGHFLRLANPARGRASRGRA